MVSIITVNYNGASDTIAMLESLRKVVVGILYEVFVVDNNSNGDDADKIEAAHPWCTVIRSDKNLGFAGGNNLALSQCNGRYVLYLNNDTYAESNFIEPMYRFMDANPLCAICSPTILYSDDRSVHYGGFRQDSYKLSRITPLYYREHEDSVPTEPQQTPFAHGAAMMVRRMAESKIGQMRNDYFLYFEEMAYSMAALMAGYQVWHLPEAKVLHKGSATIGGANPLSIYYSSRNYLYLISDYTSGIKKIALISQKILLANLKTIYKYIVNKNYDLILPHLHGTIDYILRKRGKK